MNLRDLFDVPTVSTFVVSYTKNSGTERFRLLAGRTLLTIAKATPLLVAHRSCAGKLWNDREDEGGGMRRIVQDGVGGGGPLDGSSRRFSRVQIAVEAGEVAARNLKANAVASAKDVAGRPKIDREGVDRAWREQRCALLRVAIFGAQNSFR